jgi:hypothetical protein
MKEIRIGKEQRKDPKDVNGFLYENRGNWKRVDFSQEDREQLFKWVVDHSDYCEGFEAWKVAINGQKGFLLCEYDRNNGHEGICFFTQESK